MQIDKPLTDWQLDTVWRTTAVIDLLVASRLLTILRRPMIRSCCEASI